MRRELKTALLALLACTLVLGLAYPLALTGAAQALFPTRADGDPRLIGGDHSVRPDLFQTRPSATGHAADATYFNNLGPNQRELATLLREHVRQYLRRERPFTTGLTAATIPVDAVTTSASGVDPDISEENALIQANRVAARRGLPRAEVAALVRDRASRGSVNVDDLNAAVQR